MPSIRHLIFITAISASCNTIIPLQDLNQTLLPPTQPSIFTQPTQHTLPTYQHTYTPTYYIPMDDQRASTRNPGSLQCWYITAACGFLITFLTTGMIIQQTQ
ncbi:hypothetical protein KBD08_02675 [Candidatus Babeliales bacterium]|nr:hypothetical protein [Candidatus Babeliales bacterium]